MVLNYNNQKDTKNHLTYEFLLILFLLKDPNFIRLQDSIENKKIDISSIDDYEISKLINVNNKIKYNHSISTELSKEMFSYTEALSEAILKELDIESTDIIKIEPIFKDVDFIIHTKNNSYNIEIVDEEKDYTNDFNEILNNDFIYTKQNIRILDDLIQSVLSFFKDDANIMNFDIKNINWDNYKKSEYNKSTGLKIDNKRFVMLHDYLKYIVDKSEFKDKIYLMIDKKTKDIINNIVSENLINDNFVKLLDRIFKNKKNRYVFSKQGLEVKSISKDDYEDLDEEIEVKQNIILIKLPKNEVSIEFKQDDFLSNLKFKVKVK